MPYITTERVAEIRKQIKQKFPQFKISVTRQHHSSVKVCILQAPFNMLTKGKTYEQVNHFYIADTYKDHPEIKEVLQQLYQIANEGNGTESEDGDYGTIPRFYVELRIGEFDKPFQVAIPPSVKHKVAIPPLKGVSAEQTGDVVPGEIKLINYSEKAIAIIGDTKPIKETLKAWGGRFNFRLTCGAGWIFPKTKTEEIKSKLNLV